MDYFNAFWTGGLICALVQILLDKTKLLPGRVMVLLVCSGALLSFLGFYQPFADFAGRRRHGSAARIRTYFMERYGKSNLRRWISRTVHRWFYCLRPWCLRSPDLFIFIQYDFPPTDERMR